MAKGFGDRVNSAVKASFNNNLINKDENIPIVNDVNTVPAKNMEVVSTTSEIIINSDLVHTKEIVNTNTNIVSTDNNTVKSTIKQLVKKRKASNKAQEILELFPDMTVNQIVQHFIKAIEDARLKEMHQAYNLNAKKKSFKDTRDTFSVPVRPEMKQLLDIIDHFYSINKYKLYENLFLELFKSHDFDKDLTSNDEDDD